MKFYLFIEHMIYHLSGLTFITISLYLTPVPHSTILTWLGGVVPLFIDDEHQKYIDDQMWEQNYLR